MKTIKDSKQITACQICIEIEKLTSKEMMVETMYTRNLSTGAGIIDTGEASKKDTTTRGTERYCILENRWQTRASTERQLRKQQEQVQSKEGEFDIWLFGDRDKEKDTNACRQYKSMNSPTDEFKYADNYNYNRYNYDDKYVPEEDHNWWYVNQCIPQMLA